MEVEFEPVDVSMLYEATVEEIALEGLDGITLQGLWERVTNRENAPIAKLEAPQVLESLWDSLQQDVRFRFYVLPQRRPVLRIWDRNQHHDPKGNVEEPLDAPEEIYTYRSIEVRDFEAEVPRQRAKLHLKWGRNKKLSPEEIHRINIDGQQLNPAEIVLEGISFTNSPIPVTPQPATAAKKTTRKGQLTLKSKKENAKKKQGAALKERKKVKCSPVEDGGVSIVAIRGSCTQYDTRVDITDKLRSMNVSYVNAMASMGNRLVIVANQLFRESLLFQSSNQFEVNGTQYCIVERVGRARYVGEQARGKISLTVMGVEAKNLFYLRKVLLSDGIISKQPLVMRFGESRTGTLISVFHLPQFFSRQEHPEALKIRKIFAYVCNAPNNYVDYFKIQGVFGKYMMRTLLDEYKDFVKVEEVPFATMYPEDLDKETKAKRKEFLAKKKIRVVTLQQTGLSLKDLIQKQFSKQESASMDDEDEGGAQDCGEDGEDATFDWSNCFVPERELAHESELSQVLRLLISRGGWGVKQHELTEEMSLTGLDARSAFRYLTRWKITKSHMEETGRTKATCLTYFKCEPIQKDKINQEEFIIVLDDEGNQILNPLPIDSNNSNLEVGNVILTVDPTATDGVEVLPDEAFPQMANDTDPSKLKRPFIWKSRKILPPPVVTRDSTSAQTLPGAEQEEGIKVKIPKKSRSRTSQKTEENKSILQEGEGEEPPKPKKRKEGERPPKQIRDKSPKPKSTRQPKTNRKPKTPLVQLIPPQSPSKPVEFLDVSNSQKGISKKRTAAVEESALPPPLTKRFKPRDPLVDFIDVEASNNRDRQRADWTPEEDIVVLHLFIASVIFIPRYNLDKIFVYNAVQMRDILHRKLPATKTKTSGVVRRRVHGLLKSKTLYSKYRTMLHKALRDEELYTNLIEPHLPPPSVSIFHKAPDHVLEAMLDYLENKFDPRGSGEVSLTASSMEITPTTEENKADNDEVDLETLLDARELRRMETIWTDIWANLFHAFYRTKKTLTTLVPMPPDAVQELQNEGIVIEDHGPKWALPYAPPKPTDLLASDQPCIYSDEQFEFAYDVATTLVSTADKVMTEEPPSSSSSEDEDGAITQSVKKHYGSRIALKVKGGGRVADLSTGERNPASPLEVFWWTCRSVFMSVLLGGGGTSESLRAFMAPIPDTTLSRLANSLRGRGVFTMLKTSRRLILTNGMKRKLTNFIHPSTFRAAHSLLTSLQQNNKVCFSQLSLQNIGAAYTLGEIGPLVRIDCSLPSSIITVKEEWREDYELILYSQHVASTEQGREEIALRLLRFRLNADTLKSRLVEKDFFDINLPMIQLHLKDNMPASLQAHVFSSVEELDKEKLVLQDKLLQTVQFDEEYDTLGPNKNLMLGKYEGLYKIVDITEDIGISIPFLLKHYSRKELRAGLDYLLEKQYIYFVGARFRKIVTSRHMYNWSLAMPGDDGNPQECDPLNSKRVVTRPWIDSVGGINWKLVDRIVVGLLGQLHRHSQLYIQRLAQSFSPLLSPVEVFIIISALKDLQIVDIFKFREIKPGHHFDLFCKWSELDNMKEQSDLEAPIKDYSIDTILDLEQVWVELMPFDVTKYSRIQSIILPQDKFVEEEEDDDYQRFDPEDVEIMVGQDEDEDDDDNLDNDEEILP